MKTNEEPIFDWVVEQITPKLAIATGFNKDSWDAYTGLVETDKQGIIIKVLWYERTAFSFRSENQAHLQFLQDLTNDNLKTAM